MKVGSLFSGIGGIELGFKAAGFETSWFIECEKYAKKILRKNWPKAKIYGDIKKLDFNKIERVDILTGGFPCQDISKAGKRAGIKGSRSSLWKNYLEAIRILRPRVAVIENVSALIGRGLNVVLADIASIGYDAEWHCLPASAVGAPHQRDRIFILAYPNSSGHIHRQTEINSTKARKQTFSKSQSSSETIANSNNKRFQGRREEQIRCEELWSQGWWSVEPSVCRVVDGLPNRVDRIRCLGNAVVPQIAHILALAIKSKEVEA